MNRKAYAALIALGCLIGGYLFFNWTVNRVYVPEGHSLMLRYKGPLIFGSRQPKPSRISKNAIEPDDLLL
jgi:hypothetical protein